MCDDGYFEIDWKLKCELCGKKPAVSLAKGIGFEKEQVLCEACGIKVYGENVVEDWAGTELYLKKYPDMVEVYR
jgi:transcription elongation factor Elf1